MLKKGSHDHSLRLYSACNAEKNPDVIFIFFSNTHKSGLHSTIVNMKYSYTVEKP